MREPILPSEVSVLDRNAQALGVAVRDLMQNAGQAVADVVRETASDGPVLVLCGKGNNGGDGLVAARELVSERDVRVLLAADEVTTDLAREARTDLPDAVHLERSADLDDEAIRERAGEASVLVDALLGAGARGEPRGEIGRIVDLVDQAEAFRVSVDVPTGAGTGRAFVPDATVALGAPKELDPDAEQGDLVVRDIGIPERAFTHTGPGEFALYPRLEATQHKGQGGFVLVLGGGPYTGAPALSAMAAMRTGADLAVVLTPESAADEVAAFSPNLVVRPLEGENLDLENPKNRVTLNKWLGMVDSVVVGPGLGKMEPVGDSVPIAVERLLELGLPFTVDADALWAMADNPPDLDDRAVLTPHAHEFNLMTGRAVPDPEDVEGRVKTARAAAEQLDASILLKGPTDVIASSRRAKRNAAGTPSMSHGGTGDVLTGIVAALQAKQLAAFDAARLGAFVSGKAGEQATREHSYGMLATDVVDAIPSVLKAHLPDAV
jgi:NAD(P)H-hydrate epimerase